MRRVRGSGCVFVSRMGWHDRQEKQTFTFTKKALGKNNSMFIIIWKFGTATEVLLLFYGYCSEYCRRAKALCAMKNVIRFY